MKRNGFIILLGIIGLLAVGYWWFTTQTKSKEQTVTVRSTGGAAGEKKKLVYAAHWTDFQVNGIYENGQLKTKGLKHYLEDYTALHPDIEFEIKQIPFTEYADKLKVLAQAGAAPDIYQVYSAWGVSYIKNGLFDKPPADVKADVVNNYLSTEGVTVDGEIWGIPTEINVYALLYNKELFKEAGIVDAKGEARPPRTWNELTEDAVKLTKKDASGKITQYGIAFLKGDQGQVVDPFLSVLFSNGGKYLNDDSTRSLFNSAQGVQALDAMTELFRRGATDIEGSFWDFKIGKVAMGISAPWTKASMRTGLGEKFNTAVGVAPFPGLKKSASLQYSWFMGVMSGAKYKKEAWEFLRWFTSEIQPATGTTRYGDLMVSPIGAIPARKVDLEKHQDVLGDFFTGVFVQELKNGVAEPNILESNRIREILRGEIEAAWAGKKTAQEALDKAAAQIDAILAQNAKQ